MSTITFRGGLLASLALLATAPAAADVKAGVEAWTRGEHAAAVREWQGPAQQGDADAQFNLGQAYRLGRGVEQNLARAEELFGKAAQQGHLQASDNFGLMLFQRGERAQAMPFVRAAADRGDPRAQYLLGLAHFNGDIVTKDWVRAYALLSLAQQAGLPQAAPALAQMDGYIPLEQRQQSVALAAELAAQTEATRARQLAAVDLGTSPEAALPQLPPVAVAAPLPPVVSATPRGPRIAAGEAVAAAARTAGNDSPRNAGADFTRPRPPVAAATPRPPAPVAVAQPRPVATPRPAAVAIAPRPAPPRPAPAAASSSGGDWRVQLGAFGVPGNAEAMWNRVKNRPEVSGNGKLLVRAGAVTKLQAGGYSQGAAQAACSRLSAAGIACLAVRN